MQQCQIAFSETRIVVGDLNKILIMKRLMLTQWMISVVQRDYYTGYITMHTQISCSIITARITKL